MSMPQLQRLVLLALAAALPQAAGAQAMDPSMPGMDMGAHAGHHAPQAETSAPAHDHAAAPAVAPTPADTSAPEHATGTDQAPGNAAAPAVAHDSPADRYFDSQAMAIAHAAMIDAHGAPAYSQMRINLAEVQLRSGHTGYRWEGEAWTGDFNRFVLRSKGEGVFRQGIENAQLEALYSRALDPWWNVQVGLRQDIRPTPARTHAMIGIEGLAPYKFGVMAAAYLSDKGQITATLEASVDERLTQHLILQPRLEFAFSAQDMPAQRLGDSLTTAELGLRLRYEITRQFAPYIGVSWGWAMGKTAQYRRADGQAPQQRSFVIGIRSWF